MFISDLKKGQEARIIGIHTDSTLCERLNSLGILAGEIIRVSGVSLLGGTIKIEINSCSFVALRSNEAKKIEVEIIK